MGVEVGSTLWAATAAAPATQHNLLFTGQMSSVPCCSPDVDHLMPFVLNSNRGDSFQSFYSVGIGAQYAVEWDCEWVRRTVAPDAPSRFGCLFLFQSYEDARCASSRYQWSSVLRQVRVEAIHGVHIADMETISFARGWYAAQAMWSVEHRERVWERYWRGEPATAVEMPTWTEGEQPLIQLRRYDPPTPIWEILLDGQVQVLRAKW